MLYDEFRIQLPIGTAVGASALLIAYAIRRGRWRGLRFRMVLER